MIKGSKRENSKSVAESRNGSKPKSHKGKNAIASIEKELATATLGPAAAMLPSPSTSLSMMERLAKTMANKVSGKPPAAKQKAKKVDDAPLFEEHLSPIPAGMDVDIRTHFDRWNGSAKDIRSRGLRDIYSRYRRLGHIEAYDATEPVFQVSGTDLGLQAGQTLFQMQLTPQDMPVGSSLRSTARRFTRFVISSFRIRYVPLSGTNRDGGIVITYVPDAAANQILSGADSVYYAQQGSRNNTAQTAFWAPRTVHPNMMIPVDALYCTSDDQNEQRFSSQGEFYVKTIGAVSNTAVLGTVYIDYVVHFFGPRSPNPVTYPEPVVISGGITDDDSAGNGVLSLWKLSGFPAINPAPLETGVFAIARFRLLDNAVFQNNTAGENLLIPTHRWYYVKVSLAAGTGLPTIVGTSGNYTTIFPDLPSLYAGTNILQGHPGSVTRQMEVEIVDPNPQELVVYDTEVTTVAGVPSVFTRSGRFFKQSAFSQQLGNYIMTLERRLQAYESRFKDIEDYAMVKSVSIPEHPPTLPMPRSIGAPPARYA